MSSPLTRFIQRNGPSSIEQICLGLSVERKFVVSALTSLHNKGVLVRTYDQNLNSHIYYLPGQETPFILTPLASITLHPYESPVIRCLQALGLRGHLRCTVSVVHGANDDCD